MSFVNPFNCGDSGNISQTFHTGAPISFFYTDAAQRTSATGFLPMQIGIFAFDIDTATTWQLTSISPITWKAVTGTGITVETPTGTVNGTNKTFTTTNTPLFVVMDGLVRVDGFGYSYSSPTITATLAPVEFIRSFYAA